MRIFTLVMTEVILIVSKLFRGNHYIAKAVAMVLTVTLTMYLANYLSLTRERRQTMNIKKNNFSFGKMV